MESDLALAVLRTVVGGILAAHGAQKVFGWWGGPGWAGWQGAMQRMGLRPAAGWAAISAGTELLGGLALVVGLLTPLAAAALTAQMAVIIVRAHWPRGFWNRDGGIEFPLSLAAGVVATMLLGPGDWALDAALPVQVVYEPALRWGSVAVALVGAAVALVMRPSEEPTPS
jgi:putative oxidoreductase